MYTFTNGSSSQPLQATTQIAWLARHFPKPEDQRDYARERCVVAVTEALGEAMENANITQAGLAEKLGKSRSHVSKILNGAHNMTLHTLGDMLWACEVELRDLDLMPLGVIEVATDDAKDWMTISDSAFPSRSPPSGTDQTLVWPFLVRSGSTSYDTNLIL